MTVSGLTKKPAKQSASLLPNYMKKKKRRRERDVLLFVCLPLILQGLCLLPYLCQISLDFG